MGGREVGEGGRRGRKGVKGEEWRLEREGGRWEIVSRGRE